MAGKTSGSGYDVGACGTHAARFARPWSVLRVGCEVHTLDEWIANADEIDARHGDGIASQTRALALSLRAAPVRGETEQAARMPRKETK